MDEGSSLSESPIISPVVAGNKKRKHTSDSHLLELAQNILTKPSDSCHTFGMFVASELRLIKCPKKLSSVKRKISNVLLNEEPVEDLLHFLSDGAMED